jgi:steroid 5-alpha reductase family enzyme
VACSLKTEKFYDALGSTGFISVTIATLTYTHFYHPRQIIASIFVMLWALRLGSFLLYRVLKTGKDSRFDEVLDKPGMFTHLPQPPPEMAIFSLLTWMKL